MKSICGANCSDCSLYNNKCKGCKETNGCSLGKKCWIAKYIEIGGIESFNEFKKKLLEEIKSFNIIELTNLKELIPLKGEFVNLEYTLSNNKKINFLQDDEIYLGNQIEIDFYNDNVKRYIGIVANMNFILISEYGENNDNPELLLYKKR